MTSQEAKKLSDEYEERQTKYNKKLSTRIKRYFKKRREEKIFNERFKSRYLSRIHNAAMLGEYSTEIMIYMDWGCPNPLDDKAVEKLKEMGYDVIVEDHVNTDTRYITVKWR